MRLFRLMADAQEADYPSPYPDLLLEMAVVRMASLAPVIDADELLARDRLRAAARQLRAVMLRDRRSSVIRFLGRRSRAPRPFLIRASRGFAQAASRRRGQGLGSDPRRYSQAPGSLRFPERRSHRRPCARCRSCASISFAAGAPHWLDSWSRAPRSRSKATC